MGREREGGRPPAQRQGLGSKGYILVGRERKGSRPPGSTTTHRQGLVRVYISGQREEGVTHLASRQHTDKG